MDFPVNTRDNVLICGNCQQQLENGTSRTSFQTKDFYGPSPDEIQIIDALIYIYGISWTEFLTYSEKFSKSHPEDNFQCGNTGSSITLCVLCTKLLSNNFTAHKRFENVCHPSSIVQKINTFRQQREERPVLALEPEIRPVTTWENEPHHQTTPEEDMNDDCDSPPDDGYNDDDDLFENFHIPAKEKLDDEVEIEEKFVPDIGESSPPKSHLKLEEESSAPDVVAKYSLRSRQLFVKLERLSDKQFKDPVAYSNEGKKKRRIHRVKRSDAGKKRKPRKILDNDLKDETYEPNESDSDTKEISKRKVRKEKGEKQKRNSKSKEDKCECKICGKKMRSVAHYQNVHLPRHYENVKCQHCDKMMPKRTLSKHVMTVHSDEYRKRVECPICNKMIVNYNLAQHKKLYHYGPRMMYRCDKCSKKYKNKQMYTEHMATHSENFTPYLCVVCGKTFDLPSSFECHLKKHAKGKFVERSFKCEQCPLEFVGMNALKEHRQEKHQGEDLFTCAECGKSYKLKRLLAHHIKLHKEMKEKGVKAVKCEKCNVFLKHSHSLYKHNLRFHKDVIKVYDCSFCKQRFTCATYLRKHEKKHRDNPNYCSIKKGTTRARARVSKLFKQSATADGQNDNCDPGKKFIVCTLNDNNITPLT